MKPITMFRRDVLATWFFITVLAVDISEYAGLEMISRDVLLILLILDLAWEHHSRIRTQGVRI